MKKEIEQMSDRELMMELVEAKRRAEKWERIRLCVMAALLLTVVVLAAVYVPRITATLRRVNETMDQVQAMSEQAQSFLDSFKSISAEKLAETVENVNATAQEAREIMDKLKEVGLESLEQSLKELSEFAEKLRGFFGR